MGSIENSQKKSLWWRQKCHLLSFLLLLSFSSFAQAKTHFCEEALDEHIIPANVTESFIAYLSTLVTDGVISFGKFSSFVEDLERQGRLGNPLTSSSNTQSQSYYHSENLQQYLAQTQSLDKGQILKWAKKFLTERKQAKEARKKGEAETADPNVQIKLNRVHLYGKVTYSSSDAALSPKKESLQAASVTENLDHELDVMDTPVTQMMWVNLMKENPSEFNSGLDSSVISIGGKTVSLRPNNPVEGVTLAAAMEFANRLSDQYGLPRVYDFSEAEVHPLTSAEKGNLYVQGGRIKLNSLYSNTHQAEGFRLPTEAEQNFLMNAATDDRKLFADKARMMKHVTCKQNSNNSTQHVWTRLPLQIQEQDFYDIFGNVFEYHHMLHDYNLEKQVEVGHLPPTAMEVCFIIHGGAYDLDFDLFNSNSNWFQKINTSSQSRSFRLVRSVHRK